MKLNPETLARASSRHPWRTVVDLGGRSSSRRRRLVIDAAHDALTTDFDFTNNPEAKRAQQILEERGLEQDVDAEIDHDGRRPRAPSRTPRSSTQVNAVLDEIAALGPDAVLQVPSATRCPTMQASDPRVGRARTHPLRGRHRGPVHGPS